jgi:hypothetical protein
MRPLRIYTVKAALGVLVGRLDRVIPRLRRFSSRAMPSPVASSSESRNQ